MKLVALIRIESFCLRFTSTPRQYIDNMPTDSFYPSFEVPDVGIWDFLFERKDRDFPDDKGEHAPRTLT